MLAIQSLVCQRALKGGRRSTTESGAYRLLDLLHLRGRQRGNALALVPLRGIGCGEEHVIDGRVARGIPPEQQTAKFGRVWVWRGDR